MMVCFFLEIFDFFFDIFLIFFSIFFCKIFIRELKYINSQDGIKEEA